MRKLAILAVSALLIATGIMGAMAFSRATADNPSGIQVACTTDSLLELRPGNQADSTVVVEDGALSLRLGWSDRKNGYAGMQPGSRYEFMNIVRVGRQTSSDVEWTANIEGFGDAAEFISIGRESAREIFVEKGHYKDAWRDMGGTYTWMTIVIDIPLEAEQDEINQLYEGKIIIDAKTK